MVVTLLTDFGLEDNFVGVMKGVILGINPRVRIVDITHNIKPQDIVGAAFLLRSSYKYFPKGSIHLVVVDPTVGSKRRAIIAKTKDYVFIGPDNGVLSLALKDCKKIIHVTNSKYFLKPVSNTFHGRDIFAPVAGYLSKVIPPEKFGKEIKRYRKLDIPAVKKDKDKLVGRVIYIDHFGNLITNIEKEIFDSFIDRNRFRIQFKGVSFSKINESYARAQKGRALTIFGSFNNLEISINQGNAKLYFKAKIGDTVEIKRSILTR